jgi:hypothetical protein
MLVFFLFVSQRANHIAQAKQSLVDADALLQEQTCGTGALKAL